MPSIHEVKDAKQRFYKAVLEARIRAYRAADARNKRRGYRGDCTVFVPVPDPFAGSDRPSSQGAESGAGTISDFGWEG